MEFAITSLKWQLTFLNIWLTSLNSCICLQKSNWKYLKLDWWSQNLLSISSRCLIFKLYISINFGSKKILPCAVAPRQLPTWTIAPWQSHLGPLLPDNHPPGQSPPPSPHPTENSHLQLFKWYWGVLMFWWKVLLPKVLTFLKHLHRTTTSFQTT